LKNNKKAHLGGLCAFWSIGKNGQWWVGWLLLLKSFCFFYTFWFRKKIWPQLPIVRITSFYRMWSYFPLGLIFTNPSWSNIKTHFFFRSHNCKLLWSANWRSKCEINNGSIFFDSDVIDFHLLFTYSKNDLFFSEWMLCERVLIKITWIRSFCFFIFYACNDKHHFVFWMFLFFVENQMNFW